MQCRFFDLLPVIFLLAAKLLISAETEMELENMELEYLKSAQIPEIFPKLGDDDRKFLENILRYSEYLDKDKAILVLLPLNKYIFYASLYTSNPESNSVFSVQSRGGYHDKKIIDLKDIKYGSNAVNFFKLINNEDLELVGGTENEELLKLVDYYLLWDLNISVKAGCVTAFDATNKWCLDGNIPGYKDSKLCSKYFDMKLEKICADYDYPMQRINILHDELLLGSFRLKGRDHQNFVEGLRKIAEKEVDKNITQLGFIKLPPYLGSFTGWRRSSFTNELIEILSAGPVKLNKSDKIFGECSSSSIYLEQLFEKVFSSGKAIEASLGSDGFVSFKIING